MAREKCYSINERKAVKQVFPILNSVRFDHCKRTGLIGLWTINLYRLPQEWAR